MNAQTTTRLLTLALCSSGMVHGASIWGIISTVTISSGNGISTFPNQSVTFSNGGNPVPVTDYTSPVLSDSGSYTFGGSSVSGSAMAWDTITNGANGISLHGFSTATLSGLCTLCPIITESGGVFNPIWYDTLTIGGLPNGTPVDILLTDVLHSTVSAGQTGSGEAQLGNQGVLLLNVGGSSNGTISQSNTIHTTSGSTLSFNEELDGVVSVADLTSFQTGSVDASSTGTAYITVLTPGANYTTASGLKYDAPASTPEPGCLWLTSIALVAYGSVLRYRQTSR